MNIGLPKYVHSYRDRHGQFRAYFRRKGQRSMPLPGKLGGAQFMAAYRKALEGKSGPSTSTRSRFSGLQGGPTVYFIRAGDHIKIGYSNGATDRLSGIQNGCPFKIECLLTIEGTRKLEKRLHRQFKKHRVHGEWFKAAPIILEFIDQKQRTNNLSANSLANRIECAVRA